MVNNIVLSVMARVSNFVATAKEERGQDLVEYAVLVGFIGVAAAVAFFAFMPDALTTFTDKVGACLAFDGANCTLG